MRPVVTILAAGAALLLLASGFRRTPPGPASPQSQGFAAEPAPFVPPQTETAPNVPPPQDLRQRPTRERTLDAQRAVAARHADALALCDPTRARFIDDYMISATPIVDADVAKVGAENMAKLVEQRMTEFEATVSTYLSAEQSAALRKLMHRR